MDAASASCRRAAALFAAALPMVLAGCGSSNSGGDGGVLPPPPPPGTVAWGPVVAIATNPSGVTAPSVLVDSAGLAAVLWSQTGFVPPGQSALAAPAVLAREDAGSGFAAPRLVEAPLAGDAATDQVVTLTSVALASGITSAAWLRVVGGGERIGSAGRIGGAWQSDVAALPRAGAQRDDLAFAVNAAGQRVAAWSEVVNGVRQVVAHRWNNSVAGWSALPAVQTATSIPGSQPAVAVDDDGRIMILWREGDALVGRLKSRVMPPLGTAFGTILDVDAAQTDQRAPRVVAYGPNLFVATWEQAFNNVYDLRSKAGNASNWDLSSDLIDARTEAVSGAQLMVGPNSTALVAWQQADTLFASRWAAATGNWSQPVQVGSGLSGVARNLSATSDASGSAVLVWTQTGTSGVPDLYYATVTGTAPVASAAALLESEAGAAGAPAVAVNGTGVKAVAWLQSVAGQVQPNVVARVAR
jgi:hypothetical protein